MQQGILNQQVFFQGRGLCCVFTWNKNMGNYLKCCVGLGWWFFNLSANIRRFWWTIVIIILTFFFAEYLKHVAYKQSSNVPSFFLRLKNGFRSVVFHFCDVIQNNKVFFIIIFYFIGQQEKMACRLLSQQNCFWLRVSESVGMMHTMVVRYGTTSVVV